MDMVNAMMDGYLPGDVLAEKFGLHPRYFSKNKSPENLNNNIKIIRCDRRKILVEVPHEARKYIRDYIATPFAPGDDESKYEYVLPLTNKMKIGFWK